MPNHQARFGEMFLSVNRSIFSCANDNQVTWAFSEKGDIFSENFPRKLIIFKKFKCLHTTVPNASPWLWQMQRLEDVPVEVYLQSSMSLSRLQPVARRNAGACPPPLRTRAGVVVGNRPVPGLRHYRACIMLHE